MRVRESRWKEEGLLVGDGHTQRNRWREEYEEKRERWRRKGEREERVRLHVREKGRERVHEG